MRVKLGDLKNSDYTKTEDNNNNEEYIPKYYVLDQLFNLIVKTNTDAIKNLAENHKKLYEEVIKVQSWFKIMYFADVAKDIEAHDNIIYYGAPGTGKTYKLLKTVKHLVEGDDKYFKVVQFHPSYAYEDFIDGIKPAGIDKNGNMSFELVNGLFKQMCIDAFKELQKNPKTPKKFYFIADEINRAELSRVFGEVLVCLEEDKRLRISDNGKITGLKLKTQNSQLWKSKDAVVRYNNEKYFGVPSNIKFIATMNDVDRSIDSFDLALRRRFIWRKMECNYGVISNDEKLRNTEGIEIYIEICKNLNKYISSDINLGAKYEIGHSYFLEIQKYIKDKITPQAISKLWYNNLSPLLFEYLRANYSETEIEKKLNDAKEIFTI